MTQYARTTAEISLHQFEVIDGLYSRLARMGDFMECTCPREWISLSNRLLDACIDAIGLDAVEAFESAEVCAADLICRALSSATMVTA